VKVRVEVPAGVSTGTRLRLTGRGESSGRSGQSGDLFVEIVVEPDPRFERRDADLIHHASLGVPEATLGTRIEVPTIDGEPATLEIPAGTQPGTLFTLAGRGMPVLGRRQRGDLRVVVDVAIPESISVEEEEILRRWAELRDQRSDRPATTR
jgi:molecular chaperone DnaJ